MSGRAPAFLFVAIFLTAMFAPMAEGTHNTRPGSAQWQQFPEEPAHETGFIPVDEGQREAFQRVNHEGGQTFGTLSPFLEPILNATSNATGITLFTDGVGPDGRHGGFGTWAQTGAASWQIEEAAAHSGTAGFGLGDSDAGYPDGARSLLLSPEIDLRTASPESEFEAARSQMERMMRSLGLGSVYDATVGATFGFSNETIRSVDFVHFTNFDIRYNLGAGRDGIQVWAFRSKPAAMPADCQTASDCQVLTPQGGYDDGVSAFGGEALTGSSSGWRSLTFDLSNYAQGSLWLGFAFASDADPPPSYFQDPSSFDSEAGFVGADLDNVLVRAPAPVRNIRLRPVIMPFDAPAGTDVPTAPVGVPIDVILEVANLGQGEETVLVDVDLRDRDTGQAVASVPPMQLQMTPGASATVSLPVGEPSSGPYRVHATATPDDPDSVTSFTDKPDAEPDDNSRQLDFDVETVRAPVFFSAPEPTALAVPLQEPFGYTGRVENQGNVPEAFVLQATVYDEETFENVTADVLPASQHIQAALLEPGESHTFVWNLTTTIPGHYRLFVRTPDTAPFEPADVRPQAPGTIKAAYAEPDAITIDGQLDETAWGEAAETTFSMEGTGGSRLVKMRLFNSEADLYIGLIVRDPTRDLPTAGDGDNLTLRLDDLADGLSVPGSEDGVFYTEEHPSGINGADLWLDLHYDFIGNDGLWPADAQRDGAVARTYQENDVGTPSDNEYVYEIWRPLGSASDSGDLTVTAGGFLRFAMNMTESTNGIITGSWTAPPGVALHDGDGMAAADGGLGDEMLTWRSIQLTLGPDAPAPGLRSFRAVAPAVGVGRSPPAVFMHDTSQATPVGQFTGLWTQGGGLVEGDVEERWQRAYYPDAGRLLFYFGATPESVCDGVPCAPYGTLNDQLAEEAVLSTPAIHIPEAGLPYLRFEHQFATALQSTDCTNANYPCNRGGLEPRGQVWVTAEVQDPSTGTWGGRTFLRSETTPVMAAPIGEQVVGIWDPRFPLGRTVSPSSGTGRENFCATTGGTSPIIINHGWPPCAWWWPTGEHSLRKPGGDYAVFATFSGSPWLHERIPLVSNAHGTEGATPLDLRGQIARFNFHFVHGSVAQGAADEGWRIGAVAVTPTPVQMRDVVVAGLRFASGYDPAEIGLGPGTTVKTEVRLRNEGMLDASPITVEIEGTDVLNGQRLLECESPTILLPIASGEERIVEAECTVGAVEGAALSVDVVAAFPNDDLPLNNRLPAPVLLEIRRHADAAVSIDVSPRVAPEGVVRGLPLVIENRGNVVLDTVTVQREIQAVLGGLGSQPLQTDVWELLVELEPGGNISLGHQRFGTPANAMPPISPSRDLFYSPDRPGPHRTLVRVMVSDDANHTNDLQVVPFEATNVLYAEDFETPPQRESGVVEGERNITGTEGVWHVEGPGYQDSPRRLLAGDVESRDLPDDADSAILLPSLDLTTVRSATLSFFHRYDLEEGFDGARVELSTDGGTTWDVLPARGDPLTGLPEGYPEVTLIGDSTLLGDAPESHASAYSGRSEELPGAVAGWVPAEFNLRDSPELQRRVAFEDFSLTGFAAQPASAPAVIDDVRQWTHVSWALPEPEAVDGQRYWWIENLTYQIPRPTSGGFHWWSGSRGSTSDRVFTNLSVPVDLTAPTGRQGERIFLDWWDWRDGWRDSWVTTNIIRGSPDASRRGTGGTFGVTVEASGQTWPSGPQAVEFLASGWTRREVDLTPFKGEMITVEFRYRSETSQVANRGWFIDDLRIVSYQEDPKGRRNPVVLTHHDMEGLIAEPDGSAPPFLVERHEGEASGGIPYAPTRWGLADMGSGPEKPGGWHVEQAILPDAAQGPVWRFSQPVTETDRQGYPHSADSRLVTPVIEMTKVTGTNALLRFDHKYGFESNPGFQQDGGSQSPGPTQAVDGGTIDFQVFDEGSGKFGPWQSLYDQGPQQAVIWGESLGKAYVYSDGVEALRSMGYPAVQFPTYGGGFLRYDGNLIRCCWSATEPLPVANVFSGTQEDWAQASFDVSHLIGKKVRFAFHAWSNPFYGSSQPLHGWTVANVGVEGHIFEGKPVQLRLRLATDQSLNKGEWSIDELAVVGERYGRNVAIIASSDKWHAQPGEEIVLDAKVANLGSAGRPDLGLSLVARDAQGNDVNVELETDPPLQPLEGVLNASGPFSLTPGGNPGSTLDFGVRLTLPSEPQEVQVFLRLLEDRSVPVEDDDGNFVRFPSFEEPEDEVPGNTKAVWTASGITVRNVTLQPSVPETPKLLVATPVGSQVGEPVTFTARLRNNGTTTENVNVTWGFVDRETGEPAHPDQHQDVDGLEPGEEETLSLQWTPEEEGIFRVSLRFRPPGEPEDRVATVDIPVGRSLAFFTEHFDDFDASDWEFRRTVPEEDPPRSSQWQVTEGLLRWGASPEDYASGETYCTDPPCPQTGTGPDEWARTSPSNPIDLRAAPGDHAVLILVHDFLFANCDGGRVEVAIYEDPAQPSYKFIDGSSGEPGSPAWFPLAPEGGHPGRTCSHAGNPPPERRNPLEDGTPVFTVESDGAVVTRYDLASQGIPIVGEQIALRFRVGVQAASPGGRGWTIDAVGIGAGEVGLGPQDVVGDFDADRQWPVLPGAPKRFFVTATNLGPVDDIAELSLAPTQAIDPSWVQVGEPVPLVPGETQRIPVDVSVPPDPSLDLGTRPFHVRGHSGISPLSSDELFLVLDLFRNPLPDLSVELRIDADTSKPLEAGTVVPLHAVVKNFGDARSEPVFAVIDSQPEEGVVSEVARHSLPEICPQRDCGKQDSAKVVSTDWIVPDVPGVYVVGVKVDPTNRLLEQSRANNRHELIVLVDQPERPDVAVLDLVVEGVDDRGFVEEGTFFSLNATVANLGRLSARNVQVLFFLGSALLAERTIPELGPGQIVAIDVGKTATAGEFLARVRVASGSSEADLRPENDEMARTVRVRSHALSVDSPEGPLDIAPGGAAVLPLVIHNQANSVERVEVTLVGSPPGWDVDVQPRPLNIMPNQTSSARVELQAPANASAGLHTLQLQVAPIDASHAAVETPFRVRVEALPGEIRLQSDTTAAGPPGPLVVPMKVSNEGNVARNVRLLVVEGGAGFFQMMLVPFGEESVELVVEIPPSTPPGPHTVGVILERSPSGIIVAEANVTVQVESVRRVGAQWGPIVMESVQGRDDPTRNHAVLELHLENDGNLPLNLSIVTGGTWLSGDAVFNPSRVLLDPGMTQAVVATFSANGSAPGDGAQVILVDAAAPEPLLTIDLPTLPSMPNLVVRDVALGPLASERDDSTFLVVIANEGRSASPTSVVFWFVDGVLAETTDVPALDPGDGYEANVTLGMEGGPHLVVAAVDARNEIAEVRNDDNSMSLTVDVEPRSDWVAVIPGYSTAWLLLAATLSLFALRRRRAP